MTRHFENQIHQLHLHFLYKGAIMRISGAGNNVSIPPARTLVYLSLLSEVHYF